MNTFKPDKGIRLATYASRCIENEILMYFRSQRKSAQDVSLSDYIDTGVDGAPLELMDVAEGEYIVFEHGPFDYEQECRTVEEKVEAAMREFDYAAEGCALDTQTPGRVTYFYFNPGQYFKYIRPVKRLDK